MSMMDQIVAAKDATINTLKTELERERMRLVACGIAAMSNTPESVAERLKPDHPYWSASYFDVCAAVDREMAYRDQLESSRIGNKS